MDIYFRHVVYEIRNTAERIAQVTQCHVEYDTFHQFPILQRPVRPSPDRYYDVAAK